MPPDAMASDASAAQPTPGAAVSAERTGSDRDPELDALAARPLAEHIDVYQALHTELQAALAEIDDE